MKEDPNGHRDPPLTGIIRHWTPGCARTPRNGPRRLGFHPGEQSTGHQRAYIGPARPATPWPRHAAVPRNCSLDPGHSMDCGQVQSGPGSSCQICWRSPASPPPPRAAPPVPPVAPSRRPLEGPLVPRAPLAPPSPLVSIAPACQ